MRKIYSIIIAAAAIAGCSKEVPVHLDHPVEVELPSDIEYTVDSLLYVNVSEEASVDFGKIGKYVADAKPGVVILVAKESDKDALVAAMSGWKLRDQICSFALDGKVCAVGSAQKMTVSGNGNGWSAAGFNSYSIVAGACSETIMEETSGFEGRIFILTSASDPSERFYNKTFCNCIAAQWGIMQPTSTTGATDYVFARPTQWSDTGVITIDKNAGWKHFPISFTIKKEL